MITRFDDFELDTAQFELRRNGEAVAIEPQVFALLRLLVENHDRVVTKEEIIARVWDGRFVSDSAVSSRIKSARHALDDDGNAQRYIRTVHGVGFRFVGEVRVAPTEQPATVHEPEKAPEESNLDSERPSIAVLPFRLVGTADPRLAIADALPQDLITELSRLRWLFVIARASSFRFRSEDMDLDRIRSELNVRYCLSGTVEVQGENLIVSVELCDTQDKGIVWSEQFRSRIGGVHEIREEIVRAVNNALELQIPLNEARRARLRTPGNLDVWACYHLGLQHMYRFNKADNQVATSLFERAVALDPEFARAYAGLSFTHFQDALLGYAGNVELSTRLAEQFADKCLERDPMDPFGNFTKGRAFLLRGDLDGSLHWLERANALNPNYAQAKYSHAWTESLLGLGKTSKLEVDTAMALSPLDPLLYAMYGVRAFSHIVSDEPAEAAKWGERAAHSPGAHILIKMIAMIGHGLNGSDADARRWAEITRAQSPDMTRQDFLRAFPFRQPKVRKRVSETLSRFGF
jgi:TolB-like protein